VEAGVGGIEREQGVQMQEQARKKLQEVFGVGIKMGSRGSQSWQPAACMAATAWLGQRQG
jgi:hypothetical protein